jgi:hypothetical protein
MNSLLEESGRLLNGGIRQRKESVGLSSERPNQQIYSDHKKFAAKDFVAGDFDVRVMKSKNP